RHLARLRGCPHRWLVEEEQGIYRSEVIEIFGASPTSRPTSFECFNTWTKTMSRKKRKRIFNSPEDRAAWEARSQQRVLQLRDRAAKIRAETTADMTPEQLAAWDELHCDPQPALQYYIDREAERQARRKSA